MKVRRATVDDVGALLTIKGERRFAVTARGGFLLGSTASEYLERVRSGHVWVLDVNERSVGFALTLDAQAFSLTPLWELRHRVKWTDEAPSLTSESVAYFDQLAVRRGTSGRGAAVLAFVALWHLFTTSRYVVTTTVVAPVRNRAAVPFIELVGGVCVGELDEVYEGFGPLTSGIWLLDGKSAARAVECALGSSRRNVLASVARSAAHVSPLDISKRRA